ncbi:MAG: hypothetical protein WCC43_20860 [Pseudolabrys sp.]
MARVPQATTVAYLSGGPRFLKFENEASSVLEAAGALGRQVIVVEARSDGDIEAPSRPLSNARLGRSRIRGKPSSVPACR